MGTDRYEARTPYSQDGCIPGCYTYGPAKHIDSSRFDGNKVVISPDPPANGVSIDMTAEHLFLMPNDEQPFGICPPMENPKFWKPLSEYSCLWRTFAALQIGLLQPNGADSHMDLSYDFGVDPQSWTRITTPTILSDNGNGMCAHQSKNSKVQIVRPIELIKTIYRDAFRFMNGRFDCVLVVLLALTTWDYGSDTKQQAHEAAVGRLRRLLAKPAEFLLLLVTFLSRTCVKSFSNISLQSIMIKQINGISMSHLSTLPSLRQEKHMF